MEERAFDNHEYRKEWMETGRMKDRESGRITVEKHRQTVKQIRTDSRLYRSHSLKDKLIKI